MGGLVRVTVGDEVNRIRVHQNCFFKVAQLPQAPETSLEAEAKVVQMVGLGRVTIRDEVNSIPLRRNCFLEVAQLPEVLETSSEGVGKVG